MSMDYAGRALSRRIAQYRHDSKLRSLLTLLADLINSNFEVPADVRRLLYSIDEMSGVQLDLIGRVLVQPRPSFQSVDGVYFGYAGMPDGVGYDQAPYFDYSSGSFTIINLPDTAYRKLLKAKAAKNNTDCSIDSIIRTAALVTGDDGITLTNNQDMTFELVLSQQPDEYTALLLNGYDIIPEPAGVSFAGWSVPA